MVELKGIIEKFADEVMETTRARLREQIAQMFGQSPEIRREAPGVYSIGAMRAARTPVRRASRKEIDKLYPKRNGRLARRTEAEIDAVVGKVVPLVRGVPHGMRSEQIRKALKLDVREVPRVLKRALATKVLKSKGEKRATTYFVPSKASAGGEGGKARAKKSKK